MGPYAHLWSPQSCSSCTFRYLLHIISDPLTQAKEICDTVRTPLITCFDSSLNSSQDGGVEVAPIEVSVSSTYCTATSRSTHKSERLRHHHITASFEVGLPERRQPQAGRRHRIAPRSIMRPLGRSLDCISSILLYSTPKHCSSVSHMSICFLIHIPYLLLAHIHGAYITRSLSNCILTLWS